MDIGQMFMAGFDGCTVDEHHWIAGAITRDRLGGIILFDRNVDGAMQNISGPEQLDELTAALQSYAEVPLLIAVDQEGGQVCRLKERDGFPPSVSAAQLGKSDEEEPGRQAALMAATLADHGINFNLAPVVDLDCNPDNPIIGGYERSFSADPRLVARLADVFIAAHHQRKVACCLKHFPGHGSAGSDSHLGFVDITEHWRQEELQPFSTLFRDRFCDAVMTAHVVQRRLDPSGMPATLSHAIISDLLRNRLGFTGVILTDDLQMRAISDKWGFKEAVQRAVLAGIDMVIVGNNLVRRQDAVEEGILAIAELLDMGRIDENHIRTSISRINALKKKITGEIPWPGNQPTTW